MKDTNAIDKLLVSAINTIIVIFFTLPFIFLKTNVDIRYIFLIIFFLYQIIIICTKSRRSIGMRVLKIYWNKDYTLVNHITFAVLYTLSFSTTIIWIAIPFDLLILNLLFIQLPFVCFTGYTLHGFLSGKMKGVKKTNKS
jgi:hypothetical protein